MAPQMLHRVIHGRIEPAPWQKALLKLQPAVLHGYRRHRVRGADYPGIVPVSSPSPSTSSPTSSSETSRTSVLGTLVSGLTDGDLHRLDIYEGDEYAQERVVVRTLRASLGESDAGKSAPASSAEGRLRDVLDAVGAEFADEGDEVQAVTYVWIDGRERLEEAEWDFETFKRDKMAWWVGADESEW